MNIGSGGERHMAWKPMAALVAAAVIAAPAWMAGYSPASAQADKPAATDNKGSMNKGSMKGSTQSTQGSERVTQGSAKQSTSRDRTNVRADTTTRRDTNVRHNR